MPLDVLTREHGAQLDTRDAVPRPLSFDSTNRTIEAVISSNTPVRRRDQRGEYQEILDPAGLDIAGTRGASVLNSHRQDGLGAVMGNVDDVWIEGSDVVARIRLSDRDEVRQYCDDIRNGIIRHLSVGYAVEKWTDGTGASGERTRTASKWIAKEISFVAVPADPRARTRGQGRATINREIRELASRAGVAQDVTDELIDREASVDQARAALFDQMQARSQLHLRTAEQHQTTDDPAVFVRAAGEALYARVAPGTTPAGMARQYIGMRCDDLARECLRRAGINTTALHGEALIVRALHTTSDFALILADTIGRTLRASYAAAPSGIRQLARETTADDFRMKSRLMLDSSGLVLEKVNEHGEFTSGTVVEAGESYRLDTFGRIFGITRQALVNDNLGAFADITRRLGQAAAGFEAQFLVNLLQSGSGNGPTMSDTKALFHADHGNKAASGAVPSEATLSAARLAMRKQTSPGGGLVAVTPRFLLVPSELETAAEKLLSTIQATQTSNVNPFSALSLVVEPRLTSATRWYLVAAPAEIDGLEFAYLAGAPGPQIESQAGFRVDGVETKVRLDYGAGFVDHRGWYVNAGA